MVGGRIITVIGRFLVDDKRWRRGIAGLIGMVGKLWSAMRKWALLGTAALGYAAKKVLDVQRNAESARMAMAALLEQQSARPIGFTRALQVADEQILKLREDAARLPGTFDEMRDSFNTLLPLIGKAGGDLDTVRKLAGQVIVAARLGNVIGGADVVARDIRQILSGTATAAQISTVQLKGETRRLVELARKDQAKALEAIGEALKVSDEALAAYAQTFDAQFSTAQDNVKALVKVASQPLFDAAVAKLAEFNAWLAKNRTSIEEQATIWGQKVLKWVRETATWIKDTMWPFLKKAAGALGDALYYWKEIALVAGSVKMAQFFGGLSALPPHLRAIGAEIAVIGGQIAYLVSETSDLMQFREGANRTGSAAMQRLGEEFSKVIGTPKGLEFVSAQMDKLTANNPLARQLKATGAKPAHLAASLMRTEGGREVLAQILGEYNRQNKPRPILGPELPPPPMDPFKLKGEPGKPTIDARGSTFNLKMEVVDGDPDRIALTLPQAMMRQFRPQLPAAPVPG